MAQIFVNFQKIQDFKPVLAKKYLTGISGDML